MVARGKLLPSATCVRRPMLTATSTCSSTSCCPLVGYQVWSGGRPEGRPSCWLLRAGAGSFRFWFFCCGSVDGVNTGEMLDL
eukprot:COSAG01_NODE_5975_length_3921_cov_8.965201_1_plen_82_part_00